MLGIWALGERALGQLIGPGTATLLVSPGSFSLAGQSVTFKGALANAVFAVDGANSGFSGGTYNQSLLRSGLTLGSLAATIAGSATNSLWSITPAGDAVTADEALTAGTVTFSLGSVGLGTWGATDRLLVVVFLRNSVGSSQNVTIGLRSLTSSNVTYGGAAYALNGQAVTFKFGEVAAPGAYALTGNAASLLGALTAAQGAFALTGFAITEAFYFNAAGGSYALTGFAAHYSHDFNRDSVGSSISGGNFSRQRWRDMLDEEERERAGAARKIADARHRRRAAGRPRRGGAGGGRPTRSRPRTTRRRRAGSRPCAMSRGPPARRRATAMRRPRGPRSSRTT